MLLLLGEGIFSIIPNLIHFPLTRRKHQETLLVKQPCKQTCPEAGFPGWAGLTSFFFRLEGSASGCPEVAVSALDNKTLGKRDLEVRTATCSWSAFCSNATVCRSTEDFSVEYY